MKDIKFSVTDLENIGTLLKERRMKKGISVYRLSHETGVSQVQIANAEKGENISIKIMLKLVNILYA